MGFHFVVYRVFILLMTVSASRIVMENALQADEESSLSTGCSADLGDFTTHNDDWNKMQN